MTRAAHAGAAPVVGKGAVAVRIADFLVRTELERLALFRMHLAATVRRVSPLLPELALMEGVSVGEAFGCVLPPDDWPWRPIVERPQRMFCGSSLRKAYNGAPRRYEVSAFRRAFAKPGVVIRDADHPRGRFAIRPVGSVLGFTASLGPCELHAFGATAMLKLPDPLPETLMLALPGRPLGQIVDHPLFRDGGCYVTRVFPDAADGLPILAFRAGLVPLTVQPPESCS